MWLFYEGQLTKHRLFGLRTNSVFHACFASCLLMKREKWEIYRWSIQEIKAFVFNVSRSLSLSVFFIFIFISLSLSLPPNCLLMSLTLKSFPGMINVLLGLTRSFFFKGKYKERKSEWTWNLYLPVDFISGSVSLSSPLLSWCSWIHTFRPAAPFYIHFRSRVHQDQTDVFIYSRDIWHFVPRLSLSV